MAAYLHGLLKRADDGGDGSLDGDHIIQGIQGDSFDLVIPAKLRVGVSEELYFDVIEDQSHQCARPNRDGAIMVSWIMKKRDFGDCMLSHPRRKNHPIQSASIPPLANARLARWPIFLACAQLLHGSIHPIRRLRLGKLLFILELATQAGQFLLEAGGQRLRSGLTV